MNNFLYCADLIANALIENIERNNLKEISLIDIIEYGKRVEEWWFKKYNVAITSLAFDYYYLSEAVRSFKNFFEGTSFNGKYISIRLRDDKTVDDLRKEFRSYLNEDMLKSYIESF